jgi:hypothetical protein
MDDPMAKSGLRVLEKVELSDDEESEMSYNLVGEDLDLDEDNDGDDADDSDLADALAMMEGRGTDEGNFRGQNGSTNQANETITHVRPSVPDDFIRNFLSKAGMKRTLATFSTEWYELQNKGKLPATLVDTVPDIYLRNEELDVSSAALRQQVEQMREVAAKVCSKVFLPLSFIFTP